MKFIWNEPKRCIWRGETMDFPDTNWESPVIGWLNYNDVFPIDDRDHFDMDYNYFHHFYDIVIYECREPGHGTNPRYIIEAMQNFLKKSNLTWQESNTYRWRYQDSKKPTQIPGVRFWIFAEDHVKKKARRK